MKNLKDLTTADLERAVAIKGQIEALQEELDAIGGESASIRRGPRIPKDKRKAET